jgi:hypothetical protein
MARVSRWAIFLRAFLITLLAGSPAKVGSATADEIAAWEQAEDANTVAAYYAYLSRFPAGAYVDRAIAALVSLGAIAPAPAVRQLPQQQARPSTPTPPAAAAPSAPARLY